MVFFGQKLLHTFRRVREERMLMLVEWERKWMLYKRWIQRLFTPTIMYVQYINFFFVLTPSSL